MTAARCPRLMMDTPDRRRSIAAATAEGGPMAIAWYNAIADCQAHAVDWRARAIAAERLAEEDAAHGAGSDALIDAICQRVGARDTGCGGQTVEAGEMRRRMDLTRRVDLLTADAARWQRVAPLIERLRPAAEGRDVYRSPYDLIDAVHFLLAATTDRAAPEGATPP